MSKRQTGNAEALIAWRESLPKDKNGKPIMPKRDSKKILKKKQDKVAKLRALLLAAENDAKKTDEKVNKAELKELHKTFSLQELRALKKAKVSSPAEFVAFCEKFSN